MENAAIETNLSLRKRRIRLFAGLFFGLLAALTLLGNTLVALTLPKVAVQAAEFGSLQVSYNSTTLVQSAEELSLRNPAGWKVKQVLAKEGDRVSKGGVLVTYADDSARLQIEVQQAALQKLQVQLELLQKQYILNVHNGDESAAAETRAAIESANSDISLQQAQIQGMQKALQENGRLVAPVDGIVKEVHALEGAAGVSDGPDILLVNSERGYRIELKPPAALASSLRIGDKLEVSVERADGEDNVKVEGEVANIERESFGSESSGGEEAVSAAEYRVIVKLFDDAIREGEAVSVHMELTILDEDTMLVPSSAVRVDNSGYYVLVIEERKGPLGNTKHASRRAIAVKGSSNGMSAVTGSLFEGDSVIVESEEPLSTGERVRS
ncbi:efflux RND transporter periplasmic adaptor subunit [Paenibacillus sp. HB172176]|uniref:efflux RND transporter periplasmic adaptor subunit n=1 Tax=Paenibacillus sp. HB172176 TaxID=2493690 RepID=UPI001439BCEC|nr:efflux RND transporter periplasmic adaptor subunit [Paenibacillus sp. HB172176]